jgi:hypothetical protein
LGQGKNKERKDKVGNTFLPPAVRTFFSSIILEKRWIRLRENKERKDKVRNTFLPRAVRTLIFLYRFGEKDGSGGGKIRKEKTK